MQTSVLFAWTHIPTMRTASKLWENLPLDLSTLFVHIPFSPEEHFPSFLGLSWPIFLFGFLTRINTYYPAISSN